MLERIKAVGFDLDGTFLNTHVDYGRINRADRDICLKHGIPFDDLVFNTEKRLRRPILDWLTANGRADEFDAICKEIDEELTATELEFIDEARPYPGSIECARELKSRGYKVGLLTRGSCLYGKTALTNAGVIDCFDAIVGRDFTYYDDAKPSPKAMFSFAEELGVDVAEILYLGDNKTDYHSARDAGAIFVGVCSGSMTEEGWHKEDSDMITIQYAGDVIGLL